MLTRRATTKVHVSERRALHCETFAYCAHPHLAVAADGTFLLVFNRAPRRSITLHPPQDPEYRNVLMRSSDEGRSWSAPAVVPDYDWSGVECAGLTALRDGRILLNQWRFEWLPLPLARAIERHDLVMPDALMRDLVVSPELDVFAAGGEAAHQACSSARGGGVCAVHCSDDGGRSFCHTARIDIAPFSGGYGMRGAIELPDGDILLPLSDVPHYRTVFTVRSSDRGARWSKPQLIAKGAGHAFEEPAGLLLPSGRVLVILRDNVSRVLHSIASDDHGANWSAPVPTGIEAYPAHLLALPSGVIACAAGRRAAPFGIVLHLSDDDGHSWGPPLTLIDDLPTKDLGYPTLARRANGELFVVYYARDAEGVTGIHSLTVRLS
ncbi:sialidase family protein [Methylovirgula sp. 4M-Z18]|uniref:sialidase family protein n=1 Tax=Methylovirgula sp. 4M-Z18 TaxID=2293567 RepID=UPI001314E68A|nr:sialidase family protein [Methylovirgula sp. 4M-Z18]